MKTLSLSEDVLISTVNDVKPELIKALKTKKKLHIDFSEITDCDTAGAQLLHAFILEVVRSVPNVVLLGISPVVYSAIDRAALSFEEWPVVGEEVVRG